MKRLQLILIFILVVTIPSVGSTAIGVSVDSFCPMQANMDYGASMPAEHDCCQSGMDTDKTSTSGKFKPSSPCKPGQECKICQVYPPTTAAVIVHPLAVTKAVAVRPESFLPSHAPSGLWRPPRSL